MSCLLLQKHQEESSYEEPSTGYLGTRGCGSGRSAFLEREDRAEQHRATDIAGRGHNWATAYTYELRRRRTTDRAALCGRRLLLLIKALPTG